jgi:hypothetical protein
MSFTNFLETEILDHVFAGAAYTAPSQHYLGLFTAAPGEAGGGTELSGSAYARQTVDFATSGATTSNTSGNLMAYATLSSSKAIATGDVFRVPTGDLDITLN